MDEERHADWESRISRLEERVAALRSENARLQVENRNLSQQLQHPAPPRAAPSSPDGDPVVDRRSVLKKGGLSAAAAGAASLIHAGYQPRYQKDDPEGYAGLDGNGKLRWEALPHSDNPFDLTDARSIRRLGAVGDGASHPLSEAYPTLERAQQDYPSAQSLDDEFDLVAIEQVVHEGRDRVRFGDQGQVQSGTTPVVIPDTAASYRWNRPLVIPGDKNVAFVSPANWGARIDFCGSEDYAVVCEPAEPTVGKVFVWHGLILHGAGIMIIGGNRGLIDIEYAGFVGTRRRGFLTENRYEDGEMVSWGVNNVTLRRCVFQHCKGDAWFLSDTAGFNEIDGCRFINGFDASVRVGNTHGWIHHCDWLGRSNWSERSNRPFVQFYHPSQAVGFWVLEKGRFGSEPSNYDASDDRFPPREAVLFGPHDDQPDPEGGIVGVTVRNMVFHGSHDPGPASANAGIRIAQRLMRCVVVENNYDRLDPEGAFVNEQWVDATDQQVSAWSWTHGNFGRAQEPPQFSHGGVGFLPQPVESALTGGQSPRQLLRDTHDFTASGWRSVNARVTREAHDEFLLERTARGVHAGVSQLIPEEIPLGSAVPYVFSVELESGTRNEARLWIADGGGRAVTAIDHPVRVRDHWARYAIVVPQLPAGVQRLRVWIAVGRRGDDLTGASIRARHPQLEPGFHPTGYMRNEGMPREQLPSAVQTFGGRVSVPGTAPPRAGRWQQGDRVVNVAPEAVGGEAGAAYLVSGWVCTATGSPGTWHEERTQVAG